jgi:penicillin-binding protein 1B
VAIKLKLANRSRPSGASKSGPRAVKGKRAPTHHLSLRDPLVKLFAAGFLIVAVIFLTMFTYFYVKYQRIVDRRMAGPVFSNAAKIYARPRSVSVGEKADPAEIGVQLHRAGYAQDGKDGDSRIGRFRLSSHSIQITPGPDSFQASNSAVITFEDGKVATISETGKQNPNSYDVEPQLVTALFEGQDRSKRELITFNEIPKVMVDAVLAIEDRRFFQHSGVNYFRLMEAAAIDLRAGRHGQGGSTITMQLSRGFFLSPEKTLKRKIVEVLIAFELEQKFSKQRIFEMYANQVYMGQRGSFTIAGFAEASRAYFNKDIKNITLPEAALLAGMIQRPNYLSPYKNPKRALERRNLVLDSMLDMGAITREEAERAKATPLKLAAPNVEASDAPYFVDLVKDQVSNQYSETELNEHALRIYTTVDPDLQRAAAEAVEEGMKLVDEQVIKRRTHKTKVGSGKEAKTETKVDSGPMPQVALVALDPHTGEVLALVGGRNYGMSQLNHAIAKRPTGSIFKPFVYAAAIDTALKGGASTAASEDANSGTSNAVLTPASVVDDSPVAIEYGDQLYEPRNYKEEYHGEVTLRYALAMSLNNATVRVAQEVGFPKVASLAKSAGINSVRATPAIALGAYDATPLEMAGAYTVFANGGARLPPLMVKSVRDSRGKVLENHQTESKQVLDPRVTYVMTTMMESVVNSGTGYPVRARGFQAPAAGKTGTSHDAWFAGYTTNLLCIVWVGNDDYTDLKLSGGSTAAPIWAEFMKRAVKLPQYSGTKNFPAPSGVVEVTLDKLTNRLATPTCPQDYTVAFVAGTEPKETCDQSLTDRRGVFSKIFGLGTPSVAPPPPTTNGVVAADANGAENQSASGQSVASQPPPAKKKKGFFTRLFGRGDSSGDQQQTAGTGTTENGNNSPPK